VYVVSAPTGKGEIKVVKQREPLIAPALSRERQADIIVLMHDKGIVKGLGELRIGTLRLNKKHTKKTQKCPTKEMCKQLIQLQANMLAGATVDESADESAGVSLNVPQCECDCKCGCKCSLAERARI